MRTTQYLIVGGGMTADAASKGIRDVDPDGAITPRKKSRTTN